MQVLCCVPDRHSDLAWVWRGSKSIDHLSEFPSYSPHLPSPCSQHASLPPSLATSFLAYLTFLKGLVRASLSFSFIFFIFSLFIPPFPFFHLFPPFPPFSFFFPSFFSLSETSLSYLHIFIYFTYFSSFILFPFCPYFLSFVFSLSLITFISVPHLSTSLYLSQ